MTEPRGSDVDRSTARVGEHVVWSGPRSVDDADKGVTALRTACGPDPIIAIGEPTSEVRFELGRRPVR